MPERVMIEGNEWTVCAYHQSKGDDCYRVRGHGRMAWDAVEMMEYLKHCWNYSERGCDKPKLRMKGDRNDVTG